MRAKDIKVGELYFCYLVAGDEPATALKVERKPHQFDPRYIEVTLEQPNGEIITSTPYRMAPWSEYLKELEFAEQYLKEQSARGEELSGLIDGELTFDENLRQRHSPHLEGRYVLGLNEEAALSILNLLGQEPPKPNRKTTRQAQLSRALRKALSFGLVSGYVISGRWDAIICLTEKEVEKLETLLGKKKSPDSLAELLV